MSQDTAGQDPVKKPEEEVKNNQPNASEVDDVEVISKLLDENKKLAEERENYRRGLLKEKSKNRDSGDTTEDDDLDTKIDRKVQEKLANSAFVDNQKRLEQETLRLARENKELKKAAANRSQMSSGNSGGSQAETKVGQNYFSPEKIQALKSKGWDDAKIERFRVNREKAKGGGI